MSRLVSNSLPTKPVAMTSPCPLPPLDEDVQSLLARAGTAHARELRALRKMNQALRAKLLEASAQTQQHLGPPRDMDDRRVSLFVDNTNTSRKEPPDGRTSLIESKQSSRAKLLEAQQYLEPPIAIDDCRLCLSADNRINTNPFRNELPYDRNGTIESKQSSVRLQSSNQSIESTIEDGTDEYMGAVDTWATLSRKLLQADDPKGLSCFSGLLAWKRWILMSHHLIKFQLEGNPPIAIRKRLSEFDLLSIWLSRLRRKKLQVSTSFAVETTTSFRASISKNYDNYWMGVIHPHSMKLFLWVALSGLAVLYDLYMIPLDICELVTPPASLAIAISSFWAIDMLVCCLTGVETQTGSVDMRMDTILRVYSKSWLVPDLFVLFIDVFLLGMDTGMYGTLRANRLARLIRLSRLCRLRKIGAAWRSLVNSVYAAYLLLLGKFFKYIVVIFTIDHYIACLWYGLARLNQDAEVRSWLDYAGNSADSNFACYVYSLHWALTQFSPATQDIAPQNSRERAFALCVTLFALVCFSSFVSQLTNALNQLLISKNKRDREEQAMREFFRAHHISKELGARIISYFHKRGDTQDRIGEGSIDFFSEVPESMMLVLHTEMYMDLLLENAFFKDASSSATRNTMLKICHTAMCVLSAQPAQDVFIKCSPVRHVYTITRGAMMYQYRQGGVDIQVDDWISENGLWIKCEHVGTLTASTGVRCDLSAIVLSSLISIFAGGAEPLYEPFRCLAIFAVQLLEVEAAKGFLPTDLSLSDDHKDTVCRRANAFRNLKCAVTEQADPPNCKRASQRQGLRVSSITDSIKMMSFLQRTKSPLS